MLIHFPSEETGRLRKLSRPWHGPYRVISSNATNVTAVKVYFPREDPIQVHQMRVKPCPQGFPAGFYWYGNKRKGPGRPPRWVERALTDPTTVTVEASSAESVHTPAGEGLGGPILDTAPDDPDGSRTSDAENDSSDFEEEMSDSDSEPLDSGSLQPYDLTDQENATSPSEWPPSEGTLPSGPQPRYSLRSRRKPPQRLM